MRLEQLIGSNFVVLGLVVLVVWGPAQDCWLSLRRTYPQPVMKPTKVSWQRKHWC